MRKYAEDGTWGIEKATQLCEHCAKACGGCNWSDGLEPVEGWDAQPVTIENKSESYIVRQCPEFVQGTRDDKRHRGFTYEGCVKLLAAMLKQMRKDYVFGNTETRNLIEKWLRYESTKKLLQLHDVDAVISGMRAMARREIGSKLRR